MKKVIFIVLAVFLVSPQKIGGAAARSAGTPDFRVTRRVLSENGGRLSWSKSRNLIAYDKLGSNDFYNIWTIRPDGSGDTCLTCSATVMPPLNRGNPAWSPDGRFIAFQAQQGPSLGRIGNALNRPGSGWNNDLWIMDASGRKYWRIVNVFPGRGGVIHPQFSWAGDKLTWAERTARQPFPYGTWELKVADFLVSPEGVPSVSNIRTFTPGAQKFYYEPHGFSPDDRILFFMGEPQRGQSHFGMDVYSLELATNRLTNLTDTPQQWDEFPTPMPSGRKLVWSSTAGTDSTPRRVKCDLWIMDYDGSNKKKLTFFNDPNSPDYMPDGICPADPDWNADGTQLAVYANLGRGPKFPGKLWLLSLKPVTTKH